MVWVGLNYLQTCNVCFFSHWLIFLIIPMIHELNILYIFVPCPLSLHIGCHSFYDPIHEIGNRKYIVGITIRDFPYVFVPLHS